MQRMRMIGVVALGLLLGLPAKVFAPPPPLGCCESKGGPFLAAFGLPPIRFCATSTAADCTKDLDSAFVVEHQFVPGKVCGTLGECIDPPSEGKIDTTNTIGVDAADCGTDRAQPVVQAVVGQELVNCLELCNRTQITLTRFSLTINDEPEITDQSGNLAPGDCASVKRAFRATGGLSNDDFERIRASWTASNIPPPPPDTEGDAAGLMQFTETQDAFVLTTKATAPALGPLALGALGATLLGIGLRGLVRRA